MKLDCVLTSCNDVELYIDFIPIFIKTWKKLYPSVDIKIVLINDIIPQKFIKYEKYIILFSPLQNISTAFTSQYIRLLYPALLNYQNGVLITDIDMVPMSSSYYTKNIMSLDDNKFIYYRDVLFDVNEIAMCYNVARPTVWSKIFNIKCIDDIVTKLQTAYSEIDYDNTHGGSGWNKDQLDLFKAVYYLPEFVYLDDTKTGFKRLDRGTFSTINKNVIKAEKYTDFHMNRPYSKYESTLNAIIDALPTKSPYLDYRFMMYIKPSEIKTIVEIGARDGNDSIALSTAFPDAMIYSFECNPKTVIECKNNLSNIKNVNFFDSGVGNTNEILPFYSYVIDNPGASSFYKRIDCDQTQQMTGYINIITLEKFMNDNGINTIDYLCMDVQGYELNILKGCGNMLSKIKYIIMECPKDIINETYLPKNTYSKYIGAPNPYEIKDFMSKNNFIEIERIEENKIEDNVMYKNLI